MILDFTLFKRLLSIVWPYRFWMLAGIALAFITLLANVVLLALSGWFIAGMALAGLAGVSMNYFTPAAIIRGSAITRTVGRYFERLITHDATFRMITGLRRWFYEHLEPLAPARLQQYHSGELFSRISADIDTLERFYLRFVVPAGTAVLAVLLLPLFVYYFSPLLALTFFLILIAVGAILPLYLQSISQKHADDLTELNATLRARLVDSQQGMGELLFFEGQKRNSLQSSSVFGQMIVDKQTKLFRFQTFSQIGIMAGIQVAVLVGLILLIPMIENKTLSPANLPMLILFMLAGFEAIATLPAAFQSLPVAQAAAERMFEIIDAKNIYTEPSSPKTLPESPDIKIENASFRYPETTKQILSDLSMNMPYGSKTALFGLSGSGKSSVVSLLLRFWSLDKGEILLNKLPVEDFHSDDVRSLFSVAPQKPFLFNTTIRHNLLLADKEASDDELQKVCETAHIWSLIETMPKGLDSFIGEAGTQLSGGEQKRLSIARALLKDAPVLILDEPSEGLDSHLENAVLEDVMKFTADKTVLLITHSPAALKFVDQKINF